MTTKKQIEEKIWDYFDKYNMATHEDEGGVPCADEIAQYMYDEIKKQSEWISVDERLPDNCRAVLVAVEGLTIGGAPAMVIGSYSGGFWMIADADGTHYLTKYMRYKVTHWMPLPEPPKGEQK